ncbi:MAG TPA: DUF6328 family protein [Ramlibacter sp.]|jgi:hypothetical protein
MAEDDRQTLELKDAVKLALEESRVIVPGIQALFGFQLVVVFNNRFDELFGAVAQRLHLTALVLVALSCVLLLTPAAFHRAAGNAIVSRYLLKVAARFIGWGMVPLMLAISIDVGLVGYAVMGSEGVGIAMGSAALVVNSCLWFVFPRWARRRHEAGA